MPERPEIPEELSHADAAAVSAEAAPSAPEGEAEEIGEAAPVLEDSKEHEPMIDVHMPHETHTWKGFWIHLGTITAGLLIAISLEQSVEALHHLHQRHELEAALRAEADVNKQRAELDFARYDDEMTWLLGLHEEIGKMLSTGGKANLPYRELHYRPQLLEGVPFNDTNVPLLTAVWDTAKADNRLALLPDEEAHAYSLLYHIRGESFDAHRVLARDTLAQQSAFELRFAEINTPRTPILARMSATDLKEYDVLVAQSFTANRYAKVWLKFVYGSNEAIRRGRYDFAATQRSTDEAQEAFADDYGKMAAQVAAEDAARAGAATKSAEKGGR